MTTPNFSLVDRDYILEQLRSRIVEVDFIKADGSPRTMKCTLQSSMLPKQEKPLIDLTKKPKTENLNVIAVYDIDAKGWRSFRLDSVTSLTIHTHGGSGVNVDFVESV